MTPQSEPSRRRKTVISAALIGCSLGLALLIAVLIPKLRPSEVTDAPDAAVPVRTLTLKEEDFQLTLEAYGTVRPVKLVMVSVAGPLVGTIRSPCARISSITQRITSSSVCPKKYWLDITDLSYWFGSIYDHFSTKGH